ncbi:flavin-containing monooxygenase [Deinococcus cellulosilyticus]|uniref:Monooxygenase n=1 Tax=Deinococcus cellulosilyticus (strain DSM 18568 / NBRC 106333 / KACC 11606 / 5516J-15) TaxID=1223518 RepID=A0A511MZ54_DEIC1|nr:NAD(P)/FAD-dependent oxidoreductase [Deinococcus cellulosilyticus]GEM45578.1 monooxygenase [Deinococcus cellulosilyticus NBRC 106333 = KACC 11606]
MLDTLIIGAGQAGLATAYHLKKTGLEYLLLEAADRPQGSWPTYYQSLKLFSPAGFSSLPGLLFPGDKRRCPGRDEVSQYLQDYAKHFQFPIQTGSKVVRVKPEDNGFQVLTRAGEIFHSRSVVVASGPFNRPHVPWFPGQENYTGHLLHSSQYQHSQPFAGKRVVVVGAGNSAVQIACELAEQATVTLATRESIRFAPQKLLGLDFHHYLSLIDRLPLGHLLPLGNSSLVFDTGKYRQALEAGRPDQRPVFRSFSSSGVHWADGHTEQIDAVIFATGFHPNLPFLKGTAALDSNGFPIQKHGVSLSVPGLYFVGLSGQRTLASASLRGVGRDAQAVVRSLLRGLHLSVAVCSDMDQRDFATCSDMDQGAVS